MADVDKKMKVSVEAEDKTGDALKSLGKNLGQLQGASSGLTAGLTKLGLAGIALAASWKAFNFFSASISLALEDEKALFRLEAQIRQLGISFAAVEPKIREFEEVMVAIGQHAEDTDKSITVLARVTGDLDVAMRMSKLASDLAASGMGDVESNSTALANLFNGRMRQAAAAFNIDMRSNTTAAELFDEILSRVTVKTEDLAGEHYTAIEAMKTGWDELMSKIGSASLSIIDNILKVGGALLRSKSFLMSEEEMFAKENDLLNQETYAAWQKTQKDKNIQKAIDIAQQKQDEADAIDNAKKAAEEKKKAQEALAEKIKQSFREIAATVVSSLKDQEKAIESLQKSMKDLDKSMQDDLAKSQENYRQSVADMARIAKEKMDQLDKDIADEKANRDQGWRTRVADLEKQKAEQKNIINRAGNEIGDIQNEINKDDLTLLAEKHVKEMAAIKQKTADKKAEMQKEIDERASFATGLASKASEAGFTDKAVGESMSFLGSIGAGSIQQSFIFNLPGVVAGDEGIKNLITQMIAELNRQAMLRNVGGK